MTKNHDPSDDKMPNAMPDLFQAGNKLEYSLWRSLFEQFREWPHIRNLPQPDIKRTSGVETEFFKTVKTAAEDSLLKRLIGWWREWRHPEKLPPLELTSKSIAVCDIWQKDGNAKTSVALSTAVHLIVIAAIIATSIFTFNKVAEEIKKPDTENAIDIAPYVQMPVGKGNMGGGGGGGDRDKLQAPKGKLPKKALSQITPPAIVVRNENPKLPVEPTVVVPPNITLPSGPQLGDPLSKIMGAPSNGTGSGGGIGTGSGGGVGSGTGPGVGPGHGGGYGGGAYRVGGGVSAPVAIYTPDPEYSEEARKAKYQGVCVLWLVVDANGNPRDIKVTRALGMGLDEKAIEAVRRWKFKPSEKDGKPVAAQINVEVNFRLY